MWKPELLCVTEVALFITCTNKPCLARIAGPHRQTRGGSYILQELDGAVSRRGIVYFRLLPYIPREEKQLEEMALEDEQEGIEEEDSEEER